MRRRSAIDVLAMALIAFSAAVLPSVASAVECVNVSTGEPVDCAEPGAVSEQVYDNSTLRDNEDEPEQASEQATGSASQVEVATEEGDGGDATTLALAVVAACLLAAMLGWWFVARNDSGGETQGHSTRFLVVAVAIAALLASVAGVAGASYFVEAGPAGSDGSDGAQGPAGEQGPAGPWWTTLERGGKDLEYEARRRDRRRENLFPRPIATSALLRAQPRRI